MNREAMTLVTTSRKKERFFFFSFLYDRSGSPTERTGNGSMGFYYLLLASDSRDFEAFNFCVT